jgi:DNA-binding transcriptional MocR family regulator
MLRHLIDAIDRHTVAIGGQLPAHRAAAMLDGHLFKQPGAMTIVDCRKVLTEVVARFGNDEGTILLQRYGVNALADLWVVAYAAFVDFGKACLEYDYPPSGAWGKVLPLHLEADASARHLFYHADSESHFETNAVSEYLSVMRAIESDPSADVVEVTGDPNHERGFALETEL